MAMNIGSGSDLSAFFGGTSSTNSAGSSFSLADYASIRNGSYAKLTKAYYKKQDAEESGSDVKTQKAKASAEEKLAAKATGLKAAASALTDSKSLFEKKTIKDKDGNEKQDYDWDAIGEKLQAFVDSYNETFAAASNSDVKASFNAGVGMGNAAVKNGNLLSSVGISIDKDGKLSLDKDALKEANISDLKTMFSGSGSFADSIASRASMIVSSSTNMANSIYNATGGRSSSGASAALDTLV